MPARARRVNAEVVVPEPDRRVAVEERRQPDPTENLHAWARVIRDFALVGIGVFMLFHETITNDSPSPLVVGAALVALGLPQALRLINIPLLNGDEK